MMLVLGVWVFHCHLEWHVQSGLMATFVEAPLDLQKTLKIPEDHYAACAANGVPTAGNAAGNTVDFLDLRGQNAPPDPLPSGYVFSHRYHCSGQPLTIFSLYRFTPRGIVALVFSCLAGILGIAVVAWYGFAQPVESPPSSPPLGVDGAHDAKSSVAREPELPVDDIAPVGAAAGPGTGKGVVEEEISPLRDGHH